MPIIKSAKKRVRVARKATVRNAKTRRTLKSSLKSLAKSPSAKVFNAVQSEIDRSAKKHVIHKNKAARLKRRAAAAAKAAGVKPSAATKKSSSATSIKTAPGKAGKQSTVKKSGEKPAKAAPKKPAAKKATPKKSAPKKS